MTDSRELVTRDPRLAVRTIEDVASPRPGDAVYRQCTIKVQVMVDEVPIEREVFDVLRLFDLEDVVDSRRLTPAEAASIIYHGNATVDNLLTCERYIRRYYPDITRKTVLSADFDMDGFVVGIPVACTADEVEYWEGRLSEMRRAIIADHTNMDLPLRDIIITNHWVGDDE